MSFGPVIASSPIDYLSYIRDVATGATLYTFERGNYTLDLSFTRPSQSFEVPGSDVPFDPYGQGGFPMTKRTVSLKLLKRYRAGETHTANRIALNRACGDGRQVQLALVDSAGLEWIGLGKLVGEPTHITPETMFSMDVETTFELNPPVFRRLYPSSWFFFDSPGFSFDGTPGVNGFTFDTNTLPSPALRLYARSLSIQIAPPIVGTAPISPPAAV